MKNVFLKFKPDWKSRYLLARRVTSDTNLVMLQYDLLINVLFLNNMLFSFKNVNFLPCLYCSEKEETPAYSFHSYLETETLWNKFDEHTTLYSTDFHGTEYLIKANNPGHNTLRLSLMFYQILYSREVKRSGIVSNKHGMYQLSHELVNNLRLRVLGN